MFSFESVLTDKHTFKVIDSNVNYYLYSVCHWPGLDSVPISQLLIYLLVIVLVQSSSICLANRPSHRLIKTSLTAFSHWSVCAQMAVWWQIDEALRVGFSEWAMCLSVKVWGHTCTQMHRRTHISSGCWHIDRGIKVVPAVWGIVQILRFSFSYVLM